MPEAIEFLLRRRSVPPALLIDPAPDAGQLETLLTIAARVPDHGKLQPFRFIVYSGEGRVRANALIAAAFDARNPDADEGARKKESTRFAMAPLIIGVVSTAAAHDKIPSWEQQLTAGAVCENLLIAAGAMGFGASWLTGWFAYDAEVLAQLGIHARERVAGFVHIGTAKDTVPDRPRPVLSEISSHFR